MDRNRRAKGRENRKKYKSKWKEQIEIRKSKGKEQIEGNRKAEGTSKKTRIE